MITLIERVTDAAGSAVLTLAYEQRCHSRLRARLDDGTEVALWLARGTLLRHGDVLRADSGLLVQVVAAPEAVTRAHTQDALRMRRACYHLGNRHVPVELGADFIRYRTDPVLDDLVRMLGLELTCEVARFEPESGAYLPHPHP